MTLQILMMCVLGAFLELDTTYAFQFLLSRGIIAGPLLSLVTGDLMTGVQVGVFTELIFIDSNPLGGVLPPSAVGCCTVTLALHAMGVPLCFAFFAGVLGGGFFSFMERSMRLGRCGWLVYQEQKIARKPAQLNWTIFVSLAQSLLFSLVGFVFICSVGGWLMVSLLPVIPEKMQLVSSIAYMAVPWMGLTTLICSFNLKRGGKG